jgi:hypothetical protein
MLHDFSMPTFKARFPDYRVTQLAVNGQSPIAALRDLAEDERFRGVIICDLTETEFPAAHWMAQQPNVDTYWNTPVVEYPEIVLTAFWQTRFAMINPALSLKSIIVESIRYRRLPDADTRAVRMHVDRSRDLDATRLPDIPALQARQAEGHAERLIDRMSSYGSSGWLPKWRSDVQAVGEYVRKLQGRGARVVFVRLPTQGKYWENEETYTPRAQYWDQVRTLTSADTIHFKDLHGLPEFNLPDLSHLDMRDAPAFTNRLLDELVKLGVLPEPPSADEWRASVYPR